MHKKEPISKKYLDDVKSFYFEGISPGTEDSYALANSKIEQLLKYLESPTKIVSVGVGGGEEICAASELFGPLGAEVVGLDISSKALSHAQAKLSERSLHAELIEGDATDMPFEDDSISAFIESSIIHEIYSYSDDGEKAWLRNITEITKKLHLGGVVLIRDFCCPRDKKEIELHLLTEVSVSFYIYFKKMFRVFKGKSDFSDVHDRRVEGDNYFPEIIDNKVILPSWKISELLLHFRIFFSKYEKGLVQLNDPTWKEINERYLPLHPLDMSKEPMTIEQYVAAVSQVSNQLDCIQQMTSNKQNLKEFFATHFSVQDEILLSSVTEKMELVFRKVR